MEPASCILYDNINGEIFKAFSKISFQAFVERALNFHIVPSVADFSDGLVHAQLELRRRFKELHQPKEPYIAVERELQTKCPPALWVVSTSLRDTNVKPDPFVAPSSILIPIRDLFKDQTLPLIPMLRRLEFFAILHQKIVDEDDSQWNGLLFADFSFLGYINGHIPGEVARLLTISDLSCCRELFKGLYSIDEPLPRSLRVMGSKWSTLVLIVTKLCANSPCRIENIIETTKVLLDGRNFLSGMALLEGLHQAQQDPPKLSKYWNLLNPDDNYAHYRSCWQFGYGIPFLPPHLLMSLTAKSKFRKAVALHDLLRCTPYKGLLQHTRDNPKESGSNPTRAETTYGRTCAGAFFEFTSTLWSNVFAGKYWAHLFRFSDVTEQDLENGVLPSSQVVEFYLKPQREMHGGYQDMGSISKRLHG